MSDPASLSNLRDIFAPPPVPWWPPAPGWWILAASALGALAIFIVAALRRYRRNAYRRAALVELAALAATDDPAARIRAVSAILKRAALVAYPRAETASLTGSGWLAFLDRTAGADSFTRRPGASLESAAYGAGSGDFAAILTAARRWVKRHRAAG